MGSAIFSILKDSIKNGGLKAKIGYLLLKDSLRNVKNTMDYSRVGGAPFLGLEKIVIKAHGSSKSNAIVSAIGQAVSMIKGNLNNIIKETYQNAANTPKAE
jgi:glycerol-3-phosphate acyltransferase PlsX